MKPMWMVRAGRGSRNFDVFIEAGIVAMGAKLLGPLTKQMTRDDLLRRHAEHYPNRGNSGFAHQLYRFLTEMEVGDWVVTYDRERRLYALGTIRSDYVWAPGEVEGAPHVRRVEWTHRIPRDTLSVATRNTLGSIMTLFRVNEDAAAELVARSEGADPEPGDLPEGKVEPALAAEPLSDEALLAEVVEKADEFIEDRLARLSWDQMEELVAGILRAMGYRTTVSDAGPDRGFDIFASPDGLGLQEPRIFVEVKHRNASIGAPQIRSFLGARQPGDRCLYVSTGGFTREARYEAERSSVPLRLVTMQELRWLLLEHYDKLDGETRALVPLRRLYWPADP